MSLNKLSSSLRQYWQIVLAIVIALIILLIYLNSGRANFDQNLKQIQSDPQVSQVQVIQEAQGQTLATIECEDGSKYEVYLPAGENNFDAIKSGKCGN
jgi:hypothetical protein